MEIIPAIDIRKGKCVMLTQGKLEKETIYSSDPVFMARMWQAKGAKRIHIVDLDGAFCGVPQNWPVIEEIRKSCNGIILEFGGGIRSIETIDKLVRAGYDRIIVATLSIYNPDEVRKAVEKYGEKVIGALDVVDGRVAIGGWKDITEIEAPELLKKLEEMGIKEVVVTDVMRDGMLGGANIEEIKNLATSTSIKIIASGGVGSIEDIKAIKMLERYGVTGVIVGKALYNESVIFEEALSVGSAVGYEKIS
ncbi:MAG: 1-(5-phosphoribosyl)-5-[(5-phosphoribosylamino)methylideneamino]imidazole-4-carboxamide isomerase [Elusimicrobiota bacterium]